MSELDGIALSAKYKHVEYPSECIIESEKTKKEDIVNYPSHYTSHPSGIECITIVRHHNFDIGNAIKYLWRAGLKKEQGLSDKEKEIQDLEKAIYYIKDRIKFLSESIKKEE